MFCGNTICFGDSVGGTRITFFFGTLTYFFVISLFIEDEEKALAKSKREKAEDRIRIDWSNIDEGAEDGDDEDEDYEQEESGGDSDVNEGEKEGEGNWV